MNKIVIILTVTFSVFFAPLSNAKMLSSGPYYLDGGIIPSGKSTEEPGTFSLSLTPLPINEGFDLTCDVINENYNNAYPVVIAINANYANTFTINGMRSQFDQFLLNKPTNLFKAQIFKLADANASDNTIRFRNFDTSNAVQILNCVAIYDTN